MVELTEARKRAKEMRERKPRQWLSDLDRLVMHHPVNNEFRLLSVVGVERRSAQHYFRTGHPDTARAIVRRARITLSESIVMREIRKYIEVNGVTYVAEAAE